MAQQTVVPESRREEERISKATDIEKYVKNYFEDLPVLAEIAKCESSFRHLGDEGNIIRGMKNKKDVGVMQINEKYHLEQSQRLGFDIYSLEGNLSYALYLYEKEGARPWLASSHCWSGNQELAIK